MGISSGSEVSSSSKAIQELREKQLSQQRELLN
jgi:hypothetical protein